MEMKMEKCCAAKKRISMILFFLQMCSSCFVQSKRSSLNGGNKLDSPGHYRLRFT